MGSVMATTTNIDDRVVLWELLYLVLCCIQFHHVNKWCFIKLGKVSVKTMIGMSFKKMKTSSQQTC